MKERKGQASVEYLVTYGWAFIVILVMIGALAYFGVLSPSKWVPDKCDLGAQLECADYELKSAAFVGSGSGVVNLYTRNNFGKSIQVTGAKVKKSDGSLDGSIVGPITFAAGEIKQVQISLSDATLLHQKEKQQLIVVVSMRKTGSISEHNLTGVMYAQVK